MTHKLDDMIELPKSQPKKTYKKDLECEMVMVKIPKCMSWLDAYDELIFDLDMMEDEAENLSPQSTPQVLPSFEVYTPPVTYPEEVEETIGILMEVEPLDHMKLENLGLCSHDLFLSSRGVPSVDELEPQPLPNFSSLDKNLGDKRGTDPPINLYSPGSLRIKEIWTSKDKIFPENDNAYFCSAWRRRQDLIQTASSTVAQKTLCFLNF
ncbi:hypothetical protein Tco_1297032 [Tanacetum coccineum]